MTKKEYKKARDAIIHFKGTRVFLWLRLFMTLLAFIISFVISGIEAVDLYVKESGIMDNEVTLWIYIAAYLLIFEPLSFFTLGYCSAYSAMWLDWFIDDGGSWSNWLRFTNWQYSLLCIGCFILGFVILILLFKALKKTKKSAGFFVWFAIFLLAETLVCFLGADWNVFASSYDAFSVEVAVVFLVHIVNILSFIMCCRAIYCARYLNQHFEKGMAMKVCELKKMYRENQEVPKDDEENISIE